MGTAAVFWEAHTGLKPSFFQVVFQLQEQSVPFSTHMAEQFSCHSLSAAVLSLPPPKTPETISTLLEVILRDVIDPAVKAMSRSSGATAEQKGHNN